MNAVFYISAVIAVLATAMVITRANAVHAVLYLMVSLLAVAVVFYVLGAPFAAALEVIIYAGAIMVLFVFVVMMMNLGETVAGRERAWMRPGIWIGPSILAIILMIELIYMMATIGVSHTRGVIQPAAVGIDLFGPYLLSVELSSMLLLAALVAAYHLGRMKTGSG